MPFEPRIMHGDDQPERDLTLTPDLIELAEQLSEESALLAQRYPAGSLHDRPAGRSPGGRAVRWFSVPGWRSWRGVAAAAIVSTSIWTISRDWSNVHHPANSGVVRLIDDGKGAPTVQNINSSLPAAFFQELSGPEREGLLDLLEEERLNQSSLSI